MAGGFQPGQRARYFLRAVPLASQWCYAVPCEKFGAELIATFPLIARGRVKQLRDALSDQPLTTTTA